MHSPAISPSSRRPWHSWFADLVLAALVSGPIAAPFLAASGLPGLTQISQIIYWMGMHVCPQPELGLPLTLTHLMAVCMRCYGTVLGLVLMRIVFRRDRGQAFFWLERYGLVGFGITFALCMAYPVELALQGFDWWPISHVRMAFFGCLAGLGLGAYIMPLFHSPARE
ncbi:MAG: DUF2085 domain-containing protein [Leptolyngbya sp. SIO1E4]|nr:DUF2085 domain-containing protein [Leptolyngbya sp. SIO1E4]